jgi:hypothetical protein
LIRPGSLVIVHLINPTEKFFGVLMDLAVPGITFRGINLNSFDDWVSQAVRPGEQTLGLSTLFVPLFRLERIFLDETVGEVESYQQRFANRVGIPVESYLGLAGEQEEAEVPS